MDVKEVLLPGVGLRFEFENRDGDRIGVVARRTGEFEVVVYPSDGAPRIAERFADLTREVPGLNAGQVTIRPGSPFVDRPLGDTRARTRTGASIVAIVRDEAVLASPGPGEMLRVNDVLVVIGTEDGISGVEEIVAQGNLAGPPAES
jgi:TrkA domain protein